MNEIAWDDVIKHCCRILIADDFDNVTPMEFMNYFNEIVDDYERLKRFFYELSDNCDMLMNRINDDF